MAFKDIEKSKARKGDQVTWVSNYEKFGFIKQKLKSKSASKKEGDFVPFELRKGQEIYVLYNPNVLGNRSFVPVSKIKKARRHYK